MIGKLTPGQIDLFPKYVREWTDIGLSCEPLDYDAAVYAATRAYAAAGLKPPARFIVCDSPLSGAQTAVGLRGSSVAAPVADSVLCRAAWKTWGSVSIPVTATVNNSVWEPVAISVHNLVSVPVMMAVRDSVVDDSVYGGHDAPWLSFYAYMREVLGLVEQTEPLVPLMQIAKVCGGWIPYENVCILQHRHSELHRDENGRLHNPNGMAVAYRDGWGVYAWHGIRVPEAIITGDPIVEYKATGNAEHQRVLIEKMGPERFISEIGADPVGVDGYGTLYRVNGEDFNTQIVEVVNGTPNPDGTDKTYWLTVPVLDELTGRLIRTPHDAVAWTYGLTAEQYAPQVRT